MVRRRKRTRSPGTSAVAHRQAGRDRAPPARHVLVTGGAGYIGTVLVERLLALGRRVTVLDRFFFGNTLKDLQKNQRLRLVRGDVRSCQATVFKGVDAVVDLAALSNDPAGEMDPRKTMEINAAGRARVCRLAKAAGVARYVLASSCSIYGYQDAVADETSPTRPLTTYASANRKAEKATLALAGPRFTVTALRFATAFGVSRRMRFDIAINGMTLALFKNGKVRVMRDGTQWRPMVHVRDIARAILLTLDGPTRLVQKEIFNVGGEELNLQVLPLAKRISAAVGLSFVEDWYGDPDHRSYRVSFKKFRERLGFVPEVTPEAGSVEIFDALKSGRVTDEPTTHTVDWYRTLMEWDDRLQGVRLDGRIL